MSLKLEGLPEEPLLRHGTIIRTWVFFFHDPFLSGRDSGIVSVKQTRYRLV